MSPMKFRHVAFLCAGTLALALATAGAAPVDFVREIRPILSDNCFKCHGNDPESLKGELRLDSHAGAIRPAKSGDFAIVPGKPDESELLRRVLTDDEDDHMPPAKTGKKLTPEQITKLKQWIAEGAKYQTHWAFEPVKRPDVPAGFEFGVPSSEFKLRNPIDSFVLAKLAAEQLKPSPEADKVTLLRRLHLDLVGLPPSIEEVDAFLADKSPEAYDKAVEKLLASPHYGERWGRLWLDAARYADSDGFEKDKPRDVWFYRDWVINALNDDKPYDQFIVEQIAGDLLAAQNSKPETSNPKQETRNQQLKIATGFLRNSMVNEEGGVHPEQFRMEAMFDRMDAIGKSVLGLTIQCAQCHTHKYDPITHEDYYRMFAFINDSAEGSLPVWTPEQLQKRATIFEQVTAIENDLMHRVPDWESKLAAWENALKQSQPAWTPIKIDNSGDNGQRYYDRPDGSWVASGYAPTRWTATFTNTFAATNIQAFRLELMTDPNLPSGGPGRSLEGLMALTEFKVEAQDAQNPTNKVWAKFVKAVADFSNTEQPIPPVLQDGFKEKRVTGPVAWAIDGKDETAWGIDAGPALRNQDRTAIFIAETNIAFPNGTKLTVHLRQNHGGPNSDQNQNLNLGRFRVSMTGAVPENTLPVPRRVQQILDTPRDERSQAQQAELFSFWRERVPEWQSASEQIAALWKSHPEGTTQLVLTKMAEQPRDTHLLMRGDMMKPADKVAPGVPAVLNPLPADAKPDRLTFAKWLVDRNAPTTARSIVNRIWQGYFGIGIVETSEDLGTQSPPPSHPELLDWLAAELMEPTVKAESRKPKTETDPKAENRRASNNSGTVDEVRGSEFGLPSDFEIRDSELPAWSLKHLHRLIVTSSTYRQSSRVTDELYAKDPYNRLLARGPRFRVDAEIVRDIALAASGLLNDKVGGPSVFPPAPRFLFDPPSSYGPKYWDIANGNDRYRRAFYTFRYRSIPYPALSAFDAPNGDFSCVRRARSNTPLQALTGLNETVFMESAQALAKAALTAKGSDDERIEYAFRRVLSRQPTKEEKIELLKLLSEQSEHIAAGWVDTKALAGDAVKDLPPNTSPTQLAAWTTVARVLLNLDETITKE